MRIYELMTPNVVSAMPETTLVDAALVMRNLDVGSLPVVDGGRPVGMVTDRDITVRATAEGRDPRVTRVDEVMSPGVVSCQECDDAARAARLMQDAQLRRLVVLDAAGALAGIVSLGDLVRLTRDDRLAGETLERVSEPSWVSS